MGFSGCCRPLSSNVLSPNHEIGRALTATDLLGGPGRII